MKTHITPQQAASAVRFLPPPLRDDERVAGFGVMGLPFDSGDYLAFRDFPATSFSPGYRSVWHRDPAGIWTFYASTPGPLSCSRYFSSATPVDAVQCEIDMGWPTPWSLHVSITGLIDWRVHITTSPATRVMSAIGPRLPAAAWNSSAILGGIGRLVGPLLGVGAIRLSGNTPNGQRFRIAPKRIWAVADSTATVGGKNLGRIARLPEQARLADFRLPQRGICVVGHGRFATTSVIPLTR